MANTTLSDCLNKIVGVCLDESEHPDLDNVLSQQQQRIETMKANLTDSDSHTKFQLLLNEVEHCYVDINKINQYLANEKFIMTTDTKTIETCLFKSFKLASDNMLIFHEKYHDEKLSIHAKSFLQISKSSKNELISLIESRDNDNEKETLKKRLYDKWRIVFDSVIDDARKQLDALGFFKTEIDKTTIFSNLKSHDIYELDRLFIVDINSLTKKRVYNSVRIVLFLKIAEKMKCKDVDEFRYITEYSKIKLKAEIRKRKTESGDLKMDDEKLEEYHLEEINKDALWSDQVGKELTDLKTRFETENNKSDLKFVHWISAAYHYEKHADGCLKPSEKSIPNYFKTIRKITEGPSISEKWTQDGSRRIIEYRQIDKRLREDFTAYKHEPVHGKPYIASFLNKDAKKFKKKYRDK